MSTKVTLLYGENFHAYTDFAEMGKAVILELDGKRIDLPEDFEKVLRTLIDLHTSCKYMLKHTTALDEVDGGLVSINLKTGEKKEFK